MITPFVLLRRTLAIAALLGAAGVAHAASQTWNNGSGNFIWDTSSLNWAGAAWTAGNDAVFGATGVGTITVSGTQTVGTGTALTFNTVGYTLTNGTLALAGAGNSSTFTVNASATIGSLLSGAGTLFETGSGTLTLSPGAGSTDTVGNLVVSSGTLTLASGTLNVTTSSGTGSGFRVGSSSNPTFALNGGTLITSGQPIIGGDALGGKAVFTINSGAWTNTGGFIAIMYGSSGSGSVMNVNGGLVYAPGNIQLGQNAGTSTLNLNGGTVLVNSFFNTSGSTALLNLNGGALKAISSQGNFLNLSSSGSVNVRMNGGMIDTAGNNITITTPLLHDSTLGSIPDGGLTKKGAGTLTLSGPNTYTGPTTVNGGTLSVSQPTLAATSAVTITNNAILNLNFAGTNTVMVLVLGGVQMPAGTYSAANYPTYFTGAGSLVNLAGNPISNFTWTGAVNSNWDTTTTNWSYAGSPAAWTNAGSPANAFFGVAGAGAVNLAQAISANSLTFNAAGYTIAGNVLTLGTNTPNVSVNASATLSSVVTNRAGISMAGTGTLTLSGANTFAGNVAVNAGNLVLNNQRALGFASATVANGSQIYIGTATTYTNALTLTGDGNNGALQFNGGTAAWSGPITLANGARIGGYAASGSYTLSGGIGGTGDLEIWAGGASYTHVHNFTISAPCSYTGNTLLNTYAACPVAVLSGGANTLPTNTVVTMLAGVWNGQVLSATLKLNGNNQALAGLSSGNGVFGSGGSNWVVNGSATPVTLSVNCTVNYFFDGYLGGPGANQNNFGLTKNGAAELTVNRACTCSGAVAVNAGILNLPGGLKGGSANVANGATLLLGNGTNTVASLSLSPGSALGVNLGATNNPNNTVLNVNGNLVLAGAILVQDLGNATVSNALTVINYTGNLTNLGMTNDPRSQWNVQVDTSTPGKVKLILLSKPTTIAFTTSNLTVSNSLQVQMQGIVHGFPSAPVYYEVHTPDNRLWDFGAMPPTATWTICLRHLRNGTNNVRVFTLGTGGVVQQDTRQVVLQLAANPPVRPRPYPAEIWWGGVATDLAPDYGFAQLVDPTRPWDFVRQYEDGIFLHGILPTSATLQQLAARVAPSLGRFGQEGGYYTRADPNFGVQNAAAINASEAQLQGEGINLSFHSFDYNPCMTVWPGVVDPGWCENWPNWTHDQLLNTNMNCWNDLVTILHTNWPGLKLGMTWSPVYFNWNGYPCTLSGDALTLHPVRTSSGAVVTNQYGTNAWFSFDWQEFFLQAAATAQAGDGYYGFASDCPYDYFAQWSNHGAQTTNQAKILAYEAWERTNGYFPTTICNYSQANSADTNVWDQQYMASSFAYVILKQQLGGRTHKYLFESWYSGPYTWTPESNTNSFSGMVKLAIKYLKGIADTNGTLEALNLTVTAGSGSYQQVQLQNNGDTQCLPALITLPGSVPGVTTRFFTTNGYELTTSLQTAEGLCYTNLLQPGAATNLVAVSTASGLAASTNENASLEAFWNPQDPLGIVRDREWFTPTLTPMGNWQSQDIGSVGVPGGVGLSSNVFAALGSGADIWDTADAFRFVYLPISGDATITARVSAQLATDPWAKTGVMVRESLAAGARNALIAITPGNGVTFQSRATTNGATAYTNQAGYGAPCWVRVVRSGTTLTGYYSANGTNWTQLSSASLTGLATNIHFGLAVCSHNTNAASVATFDSVAVSSMPSISSVPNQTNGWNQATAPIPFAVGSGSTAASNLLVTANSSNAALVPNGNLALSGVDSNRFLVITPSMNQTGTTTITLIVSDGAYSATNSFLATFLNLNHPPVFSLIPNSTIVAGCTLSVPVASYVTDTDTPPQTLTYNLLSGPTNATLNATSGVFTWRPLLVQAPVVTSARVTATASGSPPLSATQSFWVTVNVPVQPQISALGFNNGLFFFSIAGDAGPDYSILGSTNLADWNVIGMTSTATPPFMFTDPATTNYDQRYYRVRLGP